MWVQCSGVMCRPVNSNNELLHLLVKVRGGSHPPSGCQAAPSGPNFSKAARWDTHRGTLTPACFISCPRYPQEMAGCQIVIEDHQNGGLDAVVVQGPVGGVGAQVGRDAGRHRNRPQYPPLPLQEEGPHLPRALQDVEGVGVHRVEAVVMAEEAGRPPEVGRTGLLPNPEIATGWPEPPGTSGLAGVNYFCRILLPH